LIANEQQTMYDAFTFPMLLNALGRCILILLHFIRFVSSSSVKTTDTTYPICFLH